MASDVASPKREIIISIDVEATPGRFVPGRDNLEILIWGRGSDVEGEYGIGEMMRLSEPLGIPLTMFVEMTGLFRFGGRFLDVGTEVLERGHDLQLHLHPEHLPASFWTARGVAPPTVSSRHYLAEHAEPLIESFVALFRGAYGFAPVAYRGGSFTFTRPLYEALRKAGVPVSANHCYGTFENRGITPLAEADELHFVWENGLVELGVNQVPGEVRHHPLSIPYNKAATIPMHKVLRTEAQKPRSDGPVVMLMHSWSLLDYGEGRRFQAGGSAHRRGVFERVLTQVSELYEPITLTKFYENQRAGAYALPIKPGGFPEQYLPPDGERRRLKSKARPGRPERGEDLDA